MQHAAAVYRFIPGVAATVTPPLSKQARVRELAVLPNSKAMSRSIYHDLRYALREIRRRPGIALVPIVTLALAIGAATTVFSVVNGVLLRPLPYTDPSRLVNIWNDIGDGPSAQSLPAISAVDWRFYRQNTKTFVDLGAAVGGGELGVTGIVGGPGVTPERITVGGLSANFLTVLGVQPMLGRGFLPEEDEVGGPRTALLSHAFWQRRYSGDSTILGKSIVLDDVPRTIVGVLPPTFRLLHPAETYMLRDSDIWVPLQLDWSANGRNSFTVYTVIGRLKPGVTLEQSQVELNAIAQQLRLVNPEYKTTSLRIRGVLLHDDVVKSVKPALLVLLAAIGLLVFIASANVANLLLARASSREREVAIRLTLGASRAQLIKQLLVESALLTTIAAMLGVGVAFSALWGLRSVAPASLPRLADIAVDWTVLGFTAGLLLVTALLSGLAPALHAARRGIGDLLGGTRVANHGRQPRLRNLLVACEVALSVVLLVGAVLLMRSFINLQAVRPGFVADGALSFHIALPNGTYPSFDERRAFTANLLARLRAIPGVTSVGAVTNLPLTGQAPTQWYAYDGKPEQWQSLHAERLTVTPDYFAAAGTRLLAGRTFTEADNSTAPTVVIIDELIAKKEWPNDSPIGKRLQVFDPDRPNPYATVIGVAEHVRTGDVREDGLPQIYWSYFARTGPNMSFVVRSSVLPNRLASAAQAVVTELNASLPVTNVAPLRTYLDAALAQPRFTLILMQAVGGLAVFLAAVGLYSVIAFVVGQRTREFGIRLALGESPRGLQRQVVARGMRVVALSAAAGVVIALLSVRSIQTLLFEVNPYDPVSFGVVVVFLLCLGIVACYTPARRASRADPLVALRME
jgi:putative ABC transport system permease protein